MFDLNLNKSLVRIILVSLAMLVKLLVFAQDNSVDTSLYQNMGFVLSFDDLESSSSEQDYSGLLQSSKDVFTAISAYNFSSSRYRTRGYDSRNTFVSMNGLPLNNLENGRAIWAYWGGLNDITRYQQSMSGLSPSSFYFGGINGYSNIATRSTDLRPGTRISSAIANRNYTSRLMITHSTGLMDNGLAISVSASTRNANEGYIEGTYYSSASYFLSIEKKINKKHSLGLVGYGAPTVQGRQGIVVEEIHEILGNNFYNPNWGFQQGEKRNANVRNTHKPMLLLSHYWNLSENSKLNSTVSYSFGKGGNTRLNWYNAQDPRPNYYRYLPSYYNLPGQESDYQQVLSNWQNDVYTRQINWDELYFANRKNLFTMNDAYGIEGNTVTGNRAKYIVEEYFNNHSQYSWNSVLNLKSSENLNFDFGVYLTKYTSYNFKKINDLLGADFWVDVDQFAERDFVDPLVSQSNISTPNNLVVEGDKFGYDYNININKFNTFSQLHYKLDKVESYLSMLISGTQFWRTGNVQNGLFQNNSLGNSEKLTFFNPAVKSGLLYKFNGRHMLQTNLAYISRAPLSQNTFISPRTRNEVVPNITSETIKTSDINYLIRFPYLKLRLSAYYTLMEDKTWSRSFYHDDLKSFVNYFMTGVNQSYMGTELGAEVKLTSSLNLTTAFAAGEFLYSSRPKATIVQDNSTELLAENRTVYIKNYRVGGIPQTNASLGLKYNSSKFWFGGLTANYFANTYLDFNPDRRTSEAIQGFVSTDPQLESVLNQTKLDPGWSLDLFLGKSWKIKYGEYVRFSLNVNNILDIKDFATGGFEQLRYDFSDVDKYPNRIGYMYGRNFFAMVSYIF